MATFSTSHTCHMWRISDFSTSVMWRHLKFLHMWRNFQFPYNFDTWKAEISPHDNFFSTNIIRNIRDKYQVCGLALERNNEVRASSANPRSLCPDTSAFFFTFPYPTHIRDMIFGGRAFLFIATKLFCKLQDLPLMFSMFDKDETQFFLDNK